MATDVPYGRRLIPQILDALAASQPDRTVYSIALFADGSREFRHISARSFAKAVDKTAWWVRSQVGTPSSIRPLGYIGPHDLRHVLLTYGAVKAGCTALFLSPRNNIEGALAVLEKAQCDTWVNPSEKQLLPLVEGVMQQRPLKILQLPSLDELLDGDSVKPFPFTKRFEDAALEPFCMLHTSGTTGVPKPITWSHGLIGTMDAIRLLPPTEGDGGLTPWTSLWHDGDTIYSSFPMSHGAGIIMDILMPSLFGLKCVLGPAGVMPNLSTIESIAEHARIDIWSMVPSLVDELGEAPDVLAKFSSSKFICASGGPVSPDIATKVNDVVRILNLTGTTEGLFIGNLVVEREDWFWFAFHPYSGFEFREVEPGTYEQWIHRNEHSALFQGIFYTFPDQKSINLKDLYIKHPTKPDHWAFKGRSDDVVVLSNGYKISPLSFEAYIATHPAVSGCLVIGTAKPRAGLLLELSEDAPRTPELFDSIWAQVERAKELDLIRYQLHQAYVAFAEPEKPFIRTDKGTVKRHATLKLYTDYIERFYASRDEETDPVTVDTHSIESITDSIREILAPSLPGIHEASVDADILGLGLDSILVFRVVNAIRASLKLGDRLAPRHLYANPTLAKFSALLADLTAEARKAEANGSVNGVDDETAKLKAMIDQQKARMSIRMNPFDYVNPNHYIGLNFYFPLKEGASPQDAFHTLREGLRRTMALIPALDGKMIFDSDQIMGYKKGDLRLTIPPVQSKTVRQLVFKDFSASFPPYETLRERGFPSSAVDDYLLLPCNPFPSYPADILVAQANFINGGCILATNFHHGCLDGIGVMIAMKVWAECCRFVDGDPSATCSWLDPESFNHSLPEILHELEGHSKPLEEVDPNTWGFLPFLRPTGPENAQLTNGAPPPAADSALTNGHKPSPLPTPPVWPYKMLWPPTPDPQGRSLRTTMFLIPGPKVAALKKSVTSDPLAKGITSISDIVQAFFWRAAIRARHRVATELRGESFSDSDISILELPIDGRPYFSSLLPSTYMGSLLILNRPTLPVKKLVDPSTTVGEVAVALREAAGRISTGLYHDAFTLLKHLPDKDRFSIADMGLDGMHAMISNMILFQPEEIDLGTKHWGNGGKLETLRPQIDRGSRKFRFLVIYPMRKDGGVELVLGTLPEELEMFEKDEEFGKFAEIMDVGA